MELYKIEPEELLAEQENNLQNKWVFNNKMIYRAKVIANSNRPAKIHGWSNSAGDFYECIYNISGLIITLHQERIRYGYNSYSCDGEPPVLIAIKKEDSKDYVYNTGDDYNEAEWLDTFNQIYQESLIKKQENIQKRTLTNKQTS